MLPVDRPEKFLWQNREATESHKACIQAWVYSQEPVPLLLEGTVITVPRMYRWLQIVSLATHHLHKVNGLTDLAVGTRTGHDCETNTSVVIRI